MSSHLPATKTVTTVTAAPAPPAGSLCLLVSVSTRSVAGGGWHARAVTPSGEVLDFDSPFELVRFLSKAHRQQGCAPPDGTRTSPDGLGLR